jgi:hypothetical protein
MRYKAPLPDMVPSRHPASGLVPMSGGGVAGGPRSPEPVQPSSSEAITHGCLGRRKDPLRARQRLGAQATAGSYRRPRHEAPKSGVPQGCGRVVPTNRMLLLHDGHGRSGPVQKEPARRCQAENPPTDHRSFRSAGRHHVTRPCRSSSASVPATACTETPQLRAMSSTVWVPSI